jgi:Domain of unknown function (DUF4351)
MSQYQDDDFSKAYTTALYQTKGEVKTNVRVKSDENLEIDLLFVGNLKSDAWATEDLGIFDQMMRVHPTIFVEHYSGYLNPDHIARCGTRMDLYVSGEKKEAKKRGDRLSNAQRPFTWMLATGCSQTILRSFGATLDPSMGAGIYRLVSGLRMGVVVIRELPETPETLWLRGLGKNKILTKAFANITQLPKTKRERNDIVEVCIKHFQYLAEKSGTGLSEQEENFMKTMQEIDTIYQAEKHQAKLSGACELVLHLLNRRLSSISIDLERRVKVLPLEDLKTLGEDLLDFSQAEDLADWLDRHGG